MYIHTTPNPGSCVKSGFRSKGAATPPCCEFGKEPGREKGGCGTLGNIWLWVQTGSCSPQAPSPALSQELGDGFHPIYLLLSKGKKS